jgi:Leucine-rich repeat (LRR) protein
LKRSLIQVALGIEKAAKRPMPCLTNLQTLDCSATQVRDLAPLRGLTNLQTFICSHTQLSDLAPLQGLSNLQTLYCLRTRVSDLSRRLRASPICKRSAAHIRR